MNPSAPGWIKKHLPYFLERTLHLINSEDGLYMRFRESGFIYGTSVNTLGDEESAQLRWTELEKTKINLFDGLLYTYYDSIENAKPLDALECILEFYRKLNDKNEGYILSIGHKASVYESVEKIIHERVQTNEPLLQKTFSHLITNALLYIDILAFDHFLLTGMHPLSYVKQLETLVTQVVWLALCQKEQKDSYDDLLIKLFESSLRYTEGIDESATSIEDVKLKEFSQPLERKYILDLSCLAIWDDVAVDPNEYEFIRQLGKALSIKATEVEIAVHSVHTFIKEHYDSIAFLQHSNPVQHFYNQTSKTVSNLILRNKKRLIKEVSQSKDLVILLGQSTIRDLDKQERKLVKTQLLDICKSIPSLAIFLLPGGGVLLPLLMKFIPQLLPSAFNENYTDTD